MTTLPTTNLGFSDVRSILGVSGAASLDALCNHANVDPYGLNPTYCPGSGPTARHTNLKGPPNILGYFRGYNDDPSVFFVSNISPGTAGIARNVYGEELHADYWYRIGLYYVTGGGISIPYATSAINWFCTTSTCSYPGSFTWGTQNITYYNSSPSSPAWDYRFDTPSVYWKSAPNSGGVILAAGNYWHGFSAGGATTWLSDDFGEGTFYIDCDLYDYVLADPDYFFLDNTDQSDSFNVWTGVYSASSVTVGGTWLTVTGGVNGTGNRTQNFHVNANLGIARIGRMKITTTEAGDEYVDIDQAPV